MLVKGSAPGSDDWSQPLSARSVVLSLVLGSHPEPMTPSALGRACHLFGVAASTTRAATARAVAAGDLVRGPGGYHLGDRLLARHQHQQEGLTAADGEWNGEWEMAVVVASGRSGTRRAALRDELRRLRLAELREGVWTRPANLRRAACYTQGSVLRTFRCRPDEDPGRLARALWDLDAWAETGRLLVETLAASDPPTRRLAVAAGIVRHLASDPVLPPTLLPASWPAAALHTAYADYQQELRVLTASGARTPGTT